MPMEGKKVTIKLIKSPIGATVRQKTTIRTLGFRHLQQEIVHTSTPAILGMIEKVGRWLEVK
ncbi:MAG: 50S ribosomal protein L30 [Candidatus Riflebacteria bacterium]|nr:50S ribosomal protein L30 [Candidatus Riflebacteria bacterium]